MVRIVQKALSDACCFHPAASALDTYGTPPEEIVLDRDATDDPLHGHQEGRFFHGYYDCWCYLPLHVFCGRHLLAAKLRRANIDAAAHGPIQRRQAGGARCRRTPLCLTIRTIGPAPGLDGDPPPLAS